MIDFQRKLNNWYHINKRSLPWRNTEDPYKIWLSEIILQQTRVAQGLPYYQEFVKTYPTVFDLAKAEEQEVLKLWQGLGYYSRARNLHYSAKIVAEEYNGVFPTTYKELKKLKGVGDYTASAIASFCYGEAVAVLDGNVFRVLSRFLGIDTPINTTIGKKIFKEKADFFLDKENPGIHNQAIMEFGALQCKPKNPNCFDCPIQNNCVAFQQGKIKELPVKLKKLKIKKRNLNYLVFLSENGETLIKQRIGKGIWRNLYDFPLIESKKIWTKEDVLNHKAVEVLNLNSNQIIAFEEKPIKHQLTHQRLKIKFWIIKTNDFPENFKENKLQQIKHSELKNFPVPIVIENFLKSYGFKL